MYEVSVDETFAAGHALRDYYGKCENVHGHNFKVRVTIEGPALDGTGLLYDFVHLKKIIQDVIRPLDHQHLNEVSPFDTVNPSAENIAHYIYDETSKQMRHTAQGAGLACVTVWETDTSAATYRP